MTGRSYDSIASERRLKRNRVTDDELFKYVLHGYLSEMVADCCLLAIPLESRLYSWLSLIRVIDITYSYLSFLLTPRAPSTVSPPVNGESKEARDYQSRLSGITNSFAGFGDLIKDMAGRDGPKPVKFPEKLLKVLDQRMQDIAMGKDHV